MLKKLTVFRILAKDSYTIFGDEVIGEGAQEDFWYAANPSELFQDLFDKNTRPNTLLIPVQTV